MRLQLVTCDMLMLPVQHLSAESPHELVVSDLSASLHNEPVPLRDRIQEEIDRIEAEDYPTSMPSCWATDSVAAPRLG